MCTLYSVLYTVHCTVPYTALYGSKGVFITVFIAVAAVDGGGDCGGGGVVVVVVLAVVMVVVMVVVVVE